MLALEANWFAALVAVLSAAIWLVIWARSRQGYALLCAGGWLGLCIYWSLLAISAGPQPVLVRGSIALVVRVLLVLAAAALGGGKLWLAWLAWRRQPVADST